MPAAIEEKSMVPTILVGIGGTGAEVLARTRRLVEESYGSLNNFPIISFLVVDTDKDYKISDPEAAGTSFKDNEKHWARVTGKQVREMVTEMDKYPWISSWFPNELERNITSLEAGAGQIRACGRFAFFCNYHAIRDKFVEAVRRVKGRENFMSDRYGIKVNTNAINVFVTGSLSGGTGSGMLIDMGYGIRHWVRGEGSPIVTSIVPMPEAFAGISVGDRVLANGYAALMELSYYSDYRTEYIQQFSSGLVDEVRSPQPPFDFTYLVGTKNGESDFKLGQIREMIAQNIFLDLTSDFAPHKRSIRDNIKGAWAQADPGGRGYPKQFMSFGLSSIEIPIAQIRSALSYRLAKDLIAWWLNESVMLPAQMMDFVKNNILKRMRLTEGELIADLSANRDKSLVGIIAEWMGELRSEINREDWLDCTQQGVNMLGSERGKILRFVDEFLSPKVDEYKAEHFNELSPDERVHGDYLKAIYENRDKIIQGGKQVLEAEFYDILEDRNRGSKFADAFLVSVRQLFTTMKEKFRREQDKVWSANEENRRKQYEAAIAEINEFKDKFGISKGDKMEQLCNEALEGLQGSLVATIQRKTRGAGLMVISRLEEHLTLLERRLNRFNQKLIQCQDLFEQESNQQADSADALVINGIKLYNREELNDLYEDFIKQYAGKSEGAKTPYEMGLDSLCSTLSETILQGASPLWKTSRQANETMRLFDITELPDVQDEDFQEIINDRTRLQIQSAPENSKIKRDLAACDRLFKTFNDDADIVNNIRIAYNKSRPLLLLNEAVLRGKDAGFTPANNTNVAILGGRNTSDPATQKIIPKIQEFVGREEDLKPLGENERHRIIFVQEIGGFSLRCLDGMRDLRQSYQDWKGEFIQAKRAKQAGENRDLPIPVHLQKEPPYWDIFPEDPTVFKLGVEARALKILRQEINKLTRENVIRYQTKTVTGIENVDIASSWEEVPQVLEIRACRPDREEIQRQVTVKINAAQTPQQKQELYQELITYLQQREKALVKQGGKDSPEYKRENQIIKDLITTHRLSATQVSNPSQPEPVVSNPSNNNDVTTHLFCPQCGHQNPINFNFCSKCGTKLAK
ncbi:MAG: tubulin-like doman-containing protein [Microcystaceae cyanobacterium]